MAFAIPYSNYAKFHVLLALHEITPFEDVRIESLSPDKEALQFLGPTETEAIASKFPPNYAAQQTARMVLHKGEAIAVQSRNAVPTRRMAAPLIPLIKFRVAMVTGFV